MPASIYALAVGSMLIGLTVLVHVLDLWPGLPAGIQ